MRSDTTRRGGSVLRRWRAERADELAGRLGKSRSELYREALAGYVAPRDTGAVTSALHEIADELAADRAGFGTRAARRVLERHEW